MDEARRSVRAIDLGQFNRFVYDDLDRREFGDQFVHGDAQDVPIDRGQVRDRVLGARTTPNPFSVQEIADALRGTI